MHPRQFVFLAFRWLGLILASLCSLSARGADDEKVPESVQALVPEAQKHVADFPEVPVGTKAGEHQLFTVALDKKPLMVGADQYGCVRFTAPLGLPQDMVWVFSVPSEWAEWYIIPATGEMDGFKNWRDADRLYTDLPATKDNPAKLQTLEASSFEPGATYILWFKLNPPAEAASPQLIGAINFLPPLDDKQKRWDADAIEAGLGLKMASTAAQVDYTKSRGGKALLDRKLFTRAFADGCVDGMLTAVRSFKRFKDGTYLEIQTQLPCDPGPLAADLVSAAGEPDLIISAKERLQLAELAKAKEKPEKDVAEYFYDHFIFFVHEGKGGPRVVAVSGRAINAAQAQANQDGLTVSDAPIQETPLRIFYRDRKEIARIAFWNTSAAQVISGEIPKETFRRGDIGEESEELKYLGDGKWEYRSLYPGGEKVATTAAYEKHAQQGMEHSFYLNGKPRSDAPYDMGEVDGVVKTWDEDGKSHEYRYRAGRYVPDADAKGDKPKADAKAK